MRSDSVQLNRKEVIDTTGPSSMLWSGLENIKSTIKEQPQVEVPVEEFKTLVEKTCLLLKQV